MKNSVILTLLNLSLVATLLGGCLSNQKNEEKSVPKEVTELITQELKKGTGEAAEAGRPVVVHYTGWLFDPEAKENKGKKFDSSKDRSQPFTFRLGSGMVIKGWDEGVAGMKVGEERRLIIPADMAYGDRGAGSAIPPKSALVFDVELLEVKN